MKNFFGITTNRYEFEMNDLVTLITVLNVCLVLLGVWWGPILGIVNCCLGLLLNVINKAHLNLYIMQISLLILNMYFLTL